MFLKILKNATRVPVTVNRYVTIMQEVTIVNVILDLICLATKTLVIKVPNYNDFK